MREGENGERKWKGLEGLEGLDPTIHVRIESL
jgi:hypothetical protein